MDFDQHPQIPVNFDNPLVEGLSGPRRIPRILGVPLYEGSLEQLVQRLIQVALEDKNGSRSEDGDEKQRRNRCVSAADAHVLVQAHKNPEYKKLLNGFYLNLPDGMPIVWLARRKGFKNMHRCYGPDLFELMMKTTATTGLTHFLCGGKAGVAEELAMVCQTKFGNNNIVGTDCPPFREISDEEMRVLGEKIRASKADLVWIGLGAPKQEKFATALSAHTDSAFLFPIGAAFDFYTHRQKQAPRWMQRTGLEWTFRLAMEPRRLGKRYAEVIPKFIWLNLVSVFKKDAA